jgi:hypothetical protein
MKPSQPARVYVISASERPLVAFEATSRREAKELCKEEWFREELLSLRSGNLQIWNGEDALTARAADASCRSRSLPDKGGRKGGVSAIALALSPQDAARLTLSKS